MKIFKVYVRDITTSLATVEVNAKNWEEAQEKVNELYRVGNIEFTNKTEDLELETEEKNENI